MDTAIHSTCIVCTGVEFHVDVVQSTRVWLHVIPACLRHDQSLRHSLLVYNLAFLLMLNSVTFF